MVDRIKALCKARKTSVTKLEAELGFGNGTIGKWRNAKGSPPIDRLQKIADKLDVTVDYLLNGETIEIARSASEEQKKEAHQNGELDYDDKTLLDAYKKADDVTRELIRRALGLK